MTQRLQSQQRVQLRRTPTQPGRLCAPLPMQQLLGYNGAITHVLGRQFHCLAVSCQPAPQCGMDRRKLDVVRAARGGSAVRRCLAAPRSRRQLVTLQRLAQPTSVSSTHRAGTTLTTAGNRAVWPTVRSARSYRLSARGPACPVQQRAQYSSVYTCHQVYRRPRHLLW